MKQTLVSAETIDTLAEREQALEAFIESAISRPDPDLDPDEIEELSELLTAYRAARELALCHETTSPADSYPYLCASQLRYWLLLRILSTTEDYAMAIAP